ncbi:hypothetical protein OX89_09325 [Diaphorobacter sp. J5-51]|nr:hypothetical protein OX89_09325 [Diaphorobacter sp. J5-51]
MSREHQALFGLVRPMPEAAYTVDWQLGMLEQTLAGIESDMLGAGGSFELIPDFQRGHVWTDAQRTAYVEAIIRKTTTGRILFNCPGWSRSTSGEGDIKENTFQCIDGLQRLTAVRKFMAGDLPVFGGMSVSDLRGSPFDPFRMSYRLQIGIYEFTSRAELLQFYLDLNAGGTVHAPQEIERVRELLVQAKIDSI